MSHVPPVQSPRPEVRRKPWETVVRWRKVTSRPWPLPSAGGEGMGGAHFIHSTSVARSVAPSEGVEWEGSGVNEVDPKEVTKGTVHLIHPAPSPLAYGSR